MHVKSSWFRDVLWIILTSFGLSLLPTGAAAHHEVEEAKKAIQESLRKTFDDFNKKDINAFLDGWTDAGFMNKMMFNLDVDRPFAKDETPVFFGAMKLRGPIQLLKISNIRVLDHMMVQATAEIETLQGNVRERY
ncbi:hypothetical protein EPO44_12825, partial [bacterium]